MGVYTYKTRNRLRVRAKDMEREKSDTFGTCRNPSVGICVCVHSDTVWYVYISESISF